MSDFHSLKVKDIIRETEQAVRIIFDVPAELSETYNYTAGQYLTLKTELNGEECRRSYSICSGPGEDLSVAVKEIENGVFSTFANRKLKKGDLMDVFPPEGKFILETDKNNQKTYAAFAAGSGITPVMAMIKSVLEQEPESKFVLVFGNKSPELSIFHQELLSLQKENPERLFIEFVYSETKTENAKFGRIEKPTINYVIKNKYKALEFDHFYLCGPEEMIHHISDVLQENKVEEENISFELFHTKEDGEVPIAAEGTSHIKVIVDDEEFEFDMDQEEVILDAALQEEIDAPYSCQGGICSSCVAKIREGKATMRKNQILTDEEVEEGLVLTCQAQPTTSSVVVDYDDV
ncbi:MAG: 2Fe-2S iron-sulfur cluster-binding protein [Bacteroidota bacterium]